MEIITEIWEIITHGILFISSYSFLFIIIAIRYLDTHPYQSVIVLIIVFSSFAFLTQSWEIYKGRSNRSFFVENVVDNTSETLTYLIPYIIAFLGLQLTKWQDIFSFLILLGIVFVVYIRSNLILMNPILNAIGYKFYKVKIGTGPDILIITKKDLKAGITIKTKRISKGLYLLGDS